jgi:hypothetical protein
MRMDIENSPGARLGTKAVAARDNMGRAGGNRAAGDGRMSGKRLCSTSHPATVHGERSRRLFHERTKGILWRHSSFNLVDPRAFAQAAA